MSTPSKDAPHKDVKHHEAPHTKAPATKPAKKATPRKPAAPKASPVQDGKATLQTWIAVHNENISLQMANPVFKNLPRNAHAMASRKAITDAVAAGLVDGEGMDPLELKRYLTAKLNITGDK